MGFGELLFDTFFPLKEFFLVKATNPYPNCYLVVYVGGWGGGSAVPELTPSLFLHPTPLPPPRPPV